MGGGSQQSSSSSSSKSESWSISDFLSNSLSTSNSQSTSQNQSSSQGTSESATFESELSKEQLDILKNREDQYNEWFFPELKAAVDNADINSPEGQALLGQQAKAVNASFDASGRQIKQNLAQQGLLGSGNGVQASLNAQNQRAKSSALSAAYANQLGQMNNQKASLLGIGGGLMTTPTTSAQFHSASTSQNTSQAAGDSQSTSNSQSVSESKSHSESSSHSSSKSKGNSSGWSFSAG